LQFVLACCMILGVSTEGYDHIGNASICRYTFSL
jgi:hypothetical protein